jgi:hypothetical protein
MDMHHILWYWLYINCLKVNNSWEASQFCIAKNKLWETLTSFIFTHYCARFFCQLLILCLFHQSVTSLYRFMASYFQRPITSFFYVFLVVFLLLVFGGFILPKCKIVAHWVHRNHAYQSKQCLIHFCSSLNARMVKLGILGFSIGICTNQHSY